MNASTCSPKEGGPMSPDIAGPAHESAVTANPVSRIPSSGNPPALDRPLHRLREARRQEGLTRRTVAQRLQMTLREVQRQEQSSSDLLLSELYRWQQALNVPIVELLQETDAELSPPLQLRAQLVRAMKTVRSIQEGARQVSIQRLAQRLADQLIAVMPELSNTAAWPSVGRPRLHGEFGQAFCRRLSIDYPDGLEE